MAKKEKSLEESKKKKVPFNVLRKGAIAGLLGLTLGFGCFGLAGCSLNGTDGKDGLNGKDGANGSMWYSGTTNIEQVTDGVNGDFYIDTDDYILYQKVNGQWTAIMTNFGKPATATNIELQVASGKVQWRYKTGDDTTWKDLIEVSTITGADGNDGADGSNGIDGKDGKEIELQVGTEYIQWRYKTGEDTTWKNLMLISSLKGTDGATWLSGTTEPTTEGKNGDFYLNENNYDIWKKSDGTWTKIGNIKGSTGSAGSNGSNGQAGKDGTNIYVGYDGYVWQNGVRTTFKLDQDTEGRENVVEDTIGAYTTMGYWKGEYVDLSSNTIALMANYKPNAKLTQYSGTKVTEIQVVAESKGTLYIGTAKVADIVTARTNGTTYIATTTSYSVTAGVNTITLDLTVAEDETIVIGGNNSTAKVYVVKNLPVSDEQGNFALMDGTTHTDILAKTGDYADTLAVSVRAKDLNGESAVFEDILTQYPESSISSMKAVNQVTQPYCYNDYSYMSGKTITKIGVPVKSITASSGEKPCMTIYKIKITSTKLLNDATAITIYFPEDTTANTWAYAECNIELADDETLAFGGLSTDTLIWGFSEVTNESQYYFYNNDRQYCTYSLLFDVYYKDTNLWNVHINNLEKKEQTAIKQVKEQTLKGVLNGKNLSILGDSISTFNGYSNDSTNTNSTIGSNSIYYNGSNNGVTNVNETWWKQIADKTGMNVLVNNSSSGDKVTAGGQNRCEYLHDDTGTNAGTNPDVIAVYLGINDFDSNVSVDTFKTNYDNMISKIVTKYNNAGNYTNADIYLFTLLPNNIKKDESTLQAYNTAIKDIAEKYDCLVVDRYADSGITASNMTIYTNASDCLHPNMAGMDKMTDCFWEVLYNTYVTNAD